MCISDLFFSDRFVYSSLGRPLLLLYLRSSENCIISAACFQALIHGVEDNPVAALAKEIDLTLIPMEECKLFGTDGNSVDPTMDASIQKMWNIILDRCAEKQQLSQSDYRGCISHHHRRSVPHGNHVGSDISPAGNTDDLSVSFPTSAQQNSAAEPVGSYNEERKNLQSTARPLPRYKNQRLANGQSKSVRCSTTFGGLLEETAQEHVSKFSSRESELWNWHRGNLEMSCGAVRLGMERLRESCED